MKEGGGRGGEEENKQAGVGKLPATLYFPFDGDGFLTLLGSGCVAQLTTPNHVICDENHADGTLFSEPNRTPLCHGDSFVGHAKSAS